MTAADIEGARALWAEAEGVEISEGDEPAELERYFARNPAMSTVAYADGRLVGAVLCGHDGRRGYVYHLAVDSAHRGQGIARRLMERSLAALKAEGIRRALLLVVADNDGGKKFWLRQGWEELSAAEPMCLDL